MAVLLERAACSSEEELFSVEHRWKEHKDIVLRIEETKDRLTDIGEGFTLDQLTDMARGVDPDILHEQIAAFDEVIENVLEPAIKGLHETVGMERRELERMDGGAKGAEAAEEAEHAAARIRRLAESYVKLRLASKVLDREIERYRSENQDPVLGIASTCFSQLTKSAYTHLRADISEQGAPLLIGVRANDAWVKVDEMSSGTRDQLYLALRLASLQWRMKNGEPFPFIVDDILVNFDDGRAEATLKALAEFAGSTQVILFTHHLQTARSAQALGANIITLE
jgi:uncharacterized protein YhaN